MNSIGKRIKEIRESRGLTIYACCKKSGISNPSWASYESGEFTPKTERLKVIAATLKVDISELDPSIESVKPKKGEKTLPMITTRIRFPIRYHVPAGFHEHVDELDGHDFIDIDLERDNLTPLVVSGDSMEPKFSDKDVILVKEIPIESITNGDDYAVVTDDKTTIKRVFKDGGDFILQPMNPVYSAKTVKQIKRIFEIRYKLVALKRRRK